MFASVIECIIVQIETETESVSCGIPDSIGRLVVNLVY
jgi:hypothetical protein